MKTKILPPYAPTLIESTRAIGYTLEAAIADIIDNSIAANANKVDIFFFPIPAEEAYIAILDNGIGMSDEDLDSAMQYGSKNPKEMRKISDLGRFGLGLKTASLSQCKRLTVVTKRGNRVYGRCWDIDFVTKNGNWSLLELEEKEIKEIPEIDKLQQYKTGTLVVWQNLDRLESGEINFEQTLGRKIDGVREHLALVHHRYLSGELGITKLFLSINGREVTPIDPFLKSKSYQPMADEVLIIRGKRIIVRPYILPHISRMTQNEITQLGGKDGLRKQQGFYVYRNKRLLVWGTWFRMLRQGDLSRLARVQVDIPNTLDDLWTLDIKKSSAIPPAEVKKNLESIIEHIAEKSSRVWTTRGKKETSDKTIHIWNRMKNRDQGIYYEINREHPILKQLIVHNKSLEKYLNSALLQIERGLPLNQICVDLNNDEQLQNGQSQDDTDVSTALRFMLQLANSKTEKVKLLQKMSNIEPFSEYPQVIEEIRLEILK